MANLTANKVRAYEIHGGEFDNDVPLAANVKIYEGSAVGENGSGHFRQLVAGDAFAGFALADVGNTGLAAGANFSRVRAKGAVVVQVAGATDAASEGDVVYAADGDTFTLVAGTNTPIGKVLRWHGSGTTVSVAFEAATLRSL